MTSPDARKPGLSIVARAEERWLTPLKRNAFAARTWNFVTVAAIGAIYAGIIGYLFYRDAHTPIETARLEEIPVEIVQRPPPPPPKSPPPPEAKREIEKPASSAPRAPSEEKIETQRLDDATGGPKAATPPKDGDKAPPAPAAAPVEAAEHDKQAATAEPDVLKADAEALAKAAPLPPQKPAKLAKAPPKARPRRELTAMEQLTARAELPDYKLARPTKKAPITGGNEDNRYLSNVFAKIMSHYRPVAGAPDEAREVVVTFDVDDDGTILTMSIARGSGDDEVDAAAVAAVSRASPLPPLPRGASHGLMVRITSSSRPVARSERW